MTTTALAAFLRDLDALTRQHRLAISGCGCCGSPWIEPTSQQDRPTHLDLAYDRDTETYSTDRSRQ